MPKIKDLLHADRVFRLMDAGLTFNEAARLNKKSADSLIEAWDIAMEGRYCDHGDDDDGDVMVVHAIRS